MTRPNMRAQNHFNDHPKVSDMSSGGPRDEHGRNRSVKSAWKSINNELGTHQSQGIEVEPIRRAKIADRLTRDHHAGARRSGKERQIIKGRHE